MSLLNIYFIYPSIDWITLLLFSKFTYKYVQISPNSNKAYFLREKIMIIGKHLLLYLHRNFANNGAMTFLDWLL